MIEALIGTVIALIATGALALMSEIFASSPNSSHKQLTSYEQMLVNRVYVEKHDPELEPKIAEWLQKQEQDHPKAKLDPMEN